MSLRLVNLKIAYGGCSFFVMIENFWLEIAPHNHLQ